MRVVFVFDHFGPYHIARVRALADCSGWEVIGVELHPKSRTYGWDLNNTAGPFRKISLPHLDLIGRTERRALRPHLERVLKECVPDVVFVNGWGDFMSLETMAWARREGVRVVVMSETRRIDGARSSFSEWVKKKIVRLCDAGLCGGESHREYLAELGLPKDRVALGYNAVDNAFFGKIRRGEEFSEVEPSITKTSMLYFLASNRFVERKNLAKLIRAYAKYVESFQGSRFRFQQCSERGVWPLVLLGDGELREELVVLCADLGLRTERRFSDGVTEHTEGKRLKIRNDILKLSTNFRQDKSGATRSTDAAYASEGLGNSIYCNDIVNNSPSVVNSAKTPSAAGLVIFAGFRQIEELPAFYASAGAFIHPALSEPWGLVINEAMASGLPVISSRNVGAAEELVVDGKTGFLFDPADVEGLAVLMKRMAAMPQEERLAMGEAAAQKVADWGPERFAKGVAAAVDTAMNKPAGKVGWFDRFLLELLIRR